MSQENYETIELPGVGEVRARPGTSTLELAGAAKYWHDKCQSARHDGALGGAALILMIDLLAVGIYFYFRN